MKPRYPSRQEVLARIKPELDELRSATEYAEYRDSNAPPIHYQDYVDEKGAVPMDEEPRSNPETTSIPQAKSSCPLLENQYLFMKEIHDNPGLGLKAHYDQIGVGVEKGNLLLKELKAIGCITVNTVKTSNPKGGRSKLVATLTEKGELILKAYELKSSKA
jgi:hypothetical protein